MHSRTRSLSGALAVVFVMTVTATALAHPPWNPFDQTFFAPITQFGPKVGIKVLVKAQNDPVTGAPIGDRFVSPLKAISAPGLPNHVFIIDQPGIIWAVNMAVTPPTRTKFLDISFDTGTRPEKVIQLGVCGPDTFDERGLLGLAFHPRFRDNGKFYTYTSELEGPAATIPKAVPFDADHQNVIREWRVATPGNPSPPGGPIITHLRQLMRVDWPQFNHDGGDLAFGTDGMLYISMGDGGAADDADTTTPTFIVARPKHPEQTPDCDVADRVSGHQVNGNAQKLNTALGKIHRIDVDGASLVPAGNPFPSGPVPTIWAFGFRNPYRFSINENELFVGDVGQNDLEEMDSVPVPSRHRRVAGGLNFGWNCKEGDKFFHINGDADGFASRDPDPSRSDCRGIRLIDPIAQYDTHHEGHSIIGGYVCDKCGVTSLRGKLVFGEFARVFKFPRGPHDYGRVLAINADGDDALRSISEALILPSGDLGLAVLGIGQDAAGEVYVMGNVFGVPFGNSGVVVKLVDAPGGGNDGD